MEKGILKKQLPGDIIEEILHKLPVKSVLRFKCVSKSWRSSISSKGFVLEHLHKSNSGTDLTQNHHNLIFTYQYDHQNCQISICRNKIGSCCIGSSLDDDDDEPIPTCIRSNLSFPIPIPIFYDDIYFLGSCNGLIFITINFWELYLWNPSTRKAKNIQFPQKPSTRMLAYGFGYDESTRDYKFVCNLRFEKKQMYMYSSRADSWKTIRDFDQGSPPTGLAKFVNGKLHWLANNRTSCYIISLDLVEEKYRIVAPPDCYSDYDDHQRSVLGDLGGYLSLVCYKRRVNTMDVWVMKKDESWSKIWTFSDQFGPFPKPLWLKKNGDMVVASESLLVIYRGKDKLHQSRVEVLKSILQPVFYVESLVSPFGDYEQLCQ